ncbi:uncharacterized protein Tco025E_03636 [Trypanosoma conorhini]|uniref:Biogenesis of lysosome-related organelles complex 1 subunit 7 n=1 Tax=Trypanosoma conorhini TaxID=83891 RepID=A0A3R7L6W7_9TRYP|nr:uncharacterized protein Tco025E_03636 [Trypanosoma conorhini]RNF20996.1 hypothetical protein Tco025E_03636 [Trypanosoma conorhini]
MPEAKVEEECTPPSTARGAVGSLAALLQPALGVGNVMQSVVAQQQRLVHDIEALSAELQEAQKHFDALNESQRRKLDLYSARVARCRSKAAVLFRQLSTIKERLLRVHSVLLQRRANQSTENVVQKEELAPTASAQENVAGAFPAAEGVEKQYDDVVPAAEVGNT